MKGKEIYASFAVTLQMAKVIATVCKKYLVKMEKEFNCGWKTWTENLFWMMAIRCTRHIELIWRLQQGVPVTSDTALFTESKGWLHRFRNRFGLKNIEITGEAMSSLEDTAATFPAELKLITKEKGYVCTGGSILY